MPNELKAYKTDGTGVDINRIWARRHCTKFNGVSYISQAGAAAVYTPAGKSQISETIALYMKNASLIRRSLIKLGYQVFGGVNAPYVWLKTPNGLDSWEFFDAVLEKACVAGTPGAGFGAAGREYFRLSAFNKPGNVEQAMKRFAKV